MNEIMRVKATTGETFIFSGEIVEDIKQYLFNNGTTKPLGWVGTEEQAVNFNHVVYIEFSEEEVGE